MDRRNGGDPLAPPRPPKLLPRVHRPRAPEPAMMSDSTASAEATAAAATTTTTATPQCTKNNNNNNNNISSISRHIVSNNNNTKHSSSSSSNQGQQHFHSINPTTTTTTPNLHSNNNNVVVVVSTQPALQQQQQQLHQHQHHLQQQHHLLTTPLLQLQHQHRQTATATNLNRNNSNLSNVSSSSNSTVTAANSFTRRRPPPTPTLTPSTTSAAAVPLLTIVNGNILSGSFLNNNSSDSAPPGSPVTLAAPRPTSERLTNEYVDTPFRTTQQLQQASRAQHPAGQNVHGQTTTQHSLLLQQHQSRQQQQQQHQQQQQQQNHQQHSSSRVGTAGSATTTATTTTSNAATTTTHDGRGDQVDAFLHSNSHKAVASRATGATAGKPTSPPPPPARPHALSSSNTQPITQPITKQPACAASNAFFTKDHPAFSDDILDLHHIGVGSGISTPPLGSNSITTNGGSAPVVIGGDVTALNPITCPRCERCRCEQCQGPRQLPQTWICNKTCLCSAETIIDYASCLCCVKALFYHCAKDHEMDCDDGATTLCVDDPCSCLPHKRAQRWGWLGALSLVLPCLWCYWPMRGCAAICEKCYGRYAGHGCRCQQIGSTSSMLPIVPLGVNGSGIGGVNGQNAQNGGATMGAIKSAGGGGAHHHHHQRHHSECSAASRILRKCDLTPEKRLLDSSPEY